MEKYLNGVNFKIIEKAMVEVGFQLKKENDLYFYNKKNDNIEKLITIICRDNKVFSIEIISRHYHINSDKNIMEATLEWLLKLVGLGIENKKIMKSLESGMSLLKKREGIELIEEEEFSIRTLSANCERSLSLSVD